MAENEAEQQRLLKKAMFARRQSIKAQAGKEGQSVEYGSWCGNAIGVFTSGGDSQGMFVWIWLCGHQSVTDSVFLFFQIFHYIVRSSLKRLAL